MTEFETRTVIKAFLASPGDLGDERRRAKDVVEEVNRSVGRTWGITIELLGWEDTLPGAGRPQELINKDVDTCDLFIGALWRRWGEPTGKYSSGFEEEFERARARRQTTGTPEIWLAFKRVDPEQLQDPGEHLRKVLTFREVQRAARELLYKQFADPEDWSRQLREWVTTYVSEQARAQVRALLAPPVTSDAAPVLRSEATALQAGPESREPLPAQVQALGARVAEVLSQPDLDSYAESIARWDDFDIARLQLFSKALISVLQTNEVLSVHEMNLLYRFREQLEPIPPERALLFRTLVSDMSDLHPGWFWFSVPSVEGLSDRLIGVARNDPDASIRQRAIALLRLVGVQPMMEEHVTALRELVEDPANAVRTEALEYIGEVGGDAFLALLGEVANTAGPAVAGKAVGARMLILARLNPAEALQQAASSVGAAPRQVLDYLEQHLGSVPSDVVRTALESGDARVRRVAASQLLARGEIAEPDARRLLLDKSPAVREVACRAFLQLGLPLDPKEVYDILKPAKRQTGLFAALTIPQTEDNVDPDAVVLDIYQTFPLERLEADIDWFDVRGGLAYRALALRFFDQRQDQIRADLRDGFARIKEASVARSRVRFGEVAEEVLKQWVDLDDFIRSGFAAGALAGIATGGQSADADLARGYLPQGRKDVRYEDQALQAIRVLQRFGSSADVQQLLKLATVTFGELKSASAAAALRLTKDVFDTSRHLLESDDSRLVGLAVEALWEKSPERVVELLYPYLHSEKEASRTRVVAYFAHRHSGKELQDLLQRYLNEETYYYNVVCWFDRALHAPRPLKDAFLKQLRDSLAKD